MQKDILFKTFFHKSTSLGDITGFVSLRTLESPCMILTRLRHCPPKKSLYFTLDLPSLRSLSVFITTEVVCFRGQITSLLK